MTILGFSKRKILRFDEPIVKYWSLIAIFSILSILIIFALWMGIESLKDSHNTEILKKSISYVNSLEEKNIQIEEYVRSHTSNSAIKFQRDASDIFANHTNIVRVELRNSNGLLIREMDRPERALTWPVLSRNIAPPNVYLSLERASNLNTTQWAKSWSSMGEAMLEMLIPLGDGSLVMNLISPLNSLLPPNSNIPYDINYKYELVEHFDSSRPLLKMKISGVQAHLSLTPIKSDDWISIITDERTRLIIFMACLLIVLIIKYIVDAKDHFNRMLKIQEQSKALEENAHTQALHELSLTLAHELNQPLASMVNLVATGEILLSKKADQSEVIVTLAKARAEAMRASDILQSLRSWFKKDTSHKQFTSVHQVLNRLEPIFHSYAQNFNSKLTLINNLTINLLIDPILLEIAILNLVKNGLESMTTIDTDKRILEISTSLVAANPNQQDDPLQYAVISKSDQGTGIDKLIESEIFNFSVSSKPFGTGIGLSFCRSFAEKNGGFIKWEPKSDQGVIFSLYLPTLEENIA